MTDTETPGLAPFETTDPFDALDRWFDDLATRVGLAPLREDGPRAAGARLARTDLLETPDGFRILAELPGIPKERLELVVKGTTVEIRARADAETTREGPHYLHQERRSVEFERFIELPAPIVPGRAKAVLKEGLLTVDLPKEHPEPVPAEVRVPVE